MPCLQPKQKWDPTHGQPGRPEWICHCKGNPPSWDANCTIRHYPPPPPEEPVKEHHPVIFEGLNGCFIRCTALRTSGAAALSRVDSSAWIGMCSFFHDASSELCTAMALVGKYICTSYVDPMGLRAFVACRLIALDKCTGVRSIRNGEGAR